MSISGIKSFNEIGNRLVEISNTISNSSSFNQANISLELDRLQQNLDDLLFYDKNLNMMEFYACQKKLEEVSSAFKRAIAHTPLPQNARTSFPPFSVTPPPSHSSWQASQWMPPPAPQNASEGMRGRDVTFHLPPPPSYSSWTTPQPTQNPFGANPGSNETVSLPPPPSYSSWTAPQPTQNLFGANPRSTTTFSLPPPPSYSSTISQNLAPRVTEIPKKKEAQTDPFDLSVTELLSKFSFLMGGGQVVHKKQPFLALLDKYGHLPNKEEINENILNLSQVYSEYRSILGDGNCFYSAFVVIWLEFLHRNPATLSEAIELLFQNEGLPVLTESVCKISELNSEAFEKMLADSDLILKFVKFFRGIASRFLRDDDPTRLQVALIGSGENMTPDEYRRNVIETMGGWGDDVVVGALAEALNFPITIVRAVSQSGAGASSCNVPADRKDSKGYLLYSGVHYDIVYPTT